MATLERQSIQGLNWTESTQDLRTLFSKAVLSGILESLNTATKVCETWDPLALAAKANDEDTPNWHQAMNGPNKAGFEDAMRIEIDTLVAMGAFEMVKRQPWMNVIPSTWAFKIKRFPSGLVRKLKARFCARGDRQIEGVDYFETFAPVCNWTTIRLMLILSAQLGLATKQVDFTAAFVHADIDKPPNYEEMTPEEQAKTGVFIEMPRGFQEPGMVYRLNKSLYGLKNSPRCWFKHISSKLKGLGFEQAIDIDQCLFISPSVICLSYVDDFLLFARDMADIDEVLEKLKSDNELSLSVEDDVAGFLGVHLGREDDDIVLTQTGLIDRIVEVLGVGDLPDVDTPATDVLGKDEDGEPPNCTFNYASVIGMMWYVYGHSRPDIGMAVSQAARFAFSPRRSHELALIRIGQYLKATREKGLHLRPMDKGQFHLEAYVDSDFMGLYGKENRADPTNVKSRTGFVICLNDSPLIWASKLQESVAMSTMMAEYSALSTAMREVLPILNLVKHVAKGLGMSETLLAEFKTTIWEDNIGALTLANLEPGQHTPRSKFYDVKVHWFRSHLKPNYIEVKKIETKFQLADIFTKPLSKDVFEFLRERLMGW